MLVLHKEKRRPPEQTQHERASVLENDTILIAVTDASSEIKLHEVESDVKIISQ